MERISKPLSNVATKPKKRSSVKSDKAPQKRAKPTNNKYTAIIRQEGGWYIGWIKEIPGVNCQEKDFKTLKETLEITLKEALEFNRQDAIALAGETYQEEQISTPV